MKDFCPDDAICLKEPTCQWCGQECKKQEVVWTGDENAYEGWELWCYCEKCKTDTFHPMSKLKNENNKNFGEITFMGCPNLLHRGILSKEEMSAILARQGVVLKIDKDK